MVRTGGEEHRLSTDQKRGESTWIAQCSCGAAWRCTRMARRSVPAVHWQRLNEQCRRCVYGD